jgi:predicted RNA-binding Zn-ribbon protein involved in translation (DUF1610 family)
MTYKDQFVVEVKVNGKILRVRDDEVFLPFGSEYSLLLKNLNSSRASVKISIDGVDTLDGHSVVVGPNQTVELEGFLKGSTAKNRFRFIKKTKEIQDYRGDKIEDGLIRVEFAFEDRNPLFDNTVHHHYHHTYYNDPFGPIYRGGDVYSKGLVGGAFSSSSSGSGSASISSMSVNSINCCYNVSEASAPLPEEGITVKGSEINQNFHYTAMGTLSQSSVIVIKLKGDTSTGAQVSVPLTVATKFICKTCGRYSTSRAKYCSDCGTFLEC